MMKRIFLIAFLFIGNLQALPWKKLSTATAALFTGFIAQKKTVNAESLFYKEDGKPLTQEEHDFVYKVMLKHQFPTCLNYKKEYNPDEISTMQRIIQTRFPDIKVAFIPTTAYELFFLNMFNNEELADPEHPVARAINNMVPVKFPAFFDEPLDFKKINTNENLKGLHWYLNSHIVQKLPEKPAVMSYKKYFELVNNKDFLPGGMTIVNYDVIKKAIKQECRAYINGEFLLYRGVKDIASDTNINNDQKEHASLSFGNSLFAGLMFDNNYWDGGGACANLHIMNKQSGYMLPINKNEYVNREQLKTMFYIPALTTVAGLAGHGELFHSRTKIPASDTAQGYNGLVVPTVVHINNHNAGKIYSSIFRYIKDRHTPFKFAERCEKQAS